MGTVSVPPDEALEAELTALRERAYRPGGDIDGDPVALGRLADLEAWHAGAMHDARHDESAEPDAAADASVDAGLIVAATDSLPVPVPAVEAPEDTAPSTRGWIADVRVRFFLLGVVVAVTALLGGPVLLSWISPSPGRFEGAQEPGGVQAPNVVLRPSTTPPDTQTRGLVAALDVTLDPSTLRHYEAFGSLSLWSARDDRGNRCLVAIQPSADALLAAKCAPLGSDPTIYVSDGTVLADGGLPVGTVARFVLVGDSVSAWIYEGASRVRAP